MIRVTALLLLATISATGQDSTLVKEYCERLRQFSNPNDIDAVISNLDKLTAQYFERNPPEGGNPYQDVIRFQYRLMREIGRKCPSYALDRVHLSPKPVFDLENKLTRKEIDSLGNLTAEIAQAKKVHLFVVTIDDFYPDTTITDFANRYREFWAPRTHLEKGIVLVVFSASQRQIRISTSDMAMTYLTDDESNEVIKVMVPHFRNNNYFDGLVNGLQAIASKL